MVIRSARSAAPRGEFSCDNINTHEELPEKTDEERRKPVAYCAAENQQE